MDMNDAEVIVGATLVVARSLKGIQSIGQGQAAAPTFNSCGYTQSQTAISTLDSVGGNQAQAAKLLGIDRRTLYNKLHQWNVQ